MPTYLPRRLQRDPVSQHRSSVGADLTSNVVLSRQWQLLKHAKEISVQYAFAQRLPDMVVSDNPAEKSLNIQGGGGMMKYAYR